jgi:hypothetical protein
LVCPIYAIGANTHLMAVSSGMGGNGKGKSLHKHAFWNPLVIASTATEYHHSEQWFYWFFICEPSLNSKKYF